MKLLLLPCSSFSFFVVLKPRFVLVMPFIMFGFSWLRKVKKTFINKIKRSKILVMIKPRLRPKIQLDWKSLKVLLLILTWKCNFWRLNISFFFTIAFVYFTYFQEFFSVENTQIPQVEGVLSIRKGGNKKWEKHYVVLRASGVYYNPKGKQKVWHFLIFHIRFVTKIASRRQL